MRDLKADVLTDIAGQKDHCGDMDFTVAGPTQEKLQIALKMFGELIQSAEVGATYLGRVANPADEVSEGQEVMVKCIAVDERGKIKLSREALMPAVEGQEAPADPAAANSGPFKTAITSGKGERPRLFSLPFSVRPGFGYSWHTGDINPEDDPS